MTTDELKDRAMNAMPKSEQFSGIIALIIEGILMGVISHFVQKCMNNTDTKSIRNPWIWQKVALRNQIKVQCRKAEKLPEARQAGDLAKDLDGRYGDDMQKALLATAATIKDHELTSLQSVYGGR